MTWQRSGSGRRRISFSRMKALIRSTVARPSRVHHPLQLAGKLLSAQTPVTGGARHQFSFEKFLVIPQERRHLRGPRFQSLPLPCFSRKSKNAFLVEGNRAAVLSDGGLEDRARR